VAEISAAVSVSLTKAAGARGGAPVARLCISLSGASGGEQAR
jgi:hypothetical protein